MYALNRVITGFGSFEEVGFALAVYGCTFDKLSHAVLFLKLLFLFPFPFFQTRFVGIETLKYVSPLRRLQPS